MPAQPGAIGWVDLTASNASAVKDFYAAVVGWKTSAVEMGGYEDWCMHPHAGAEPVAGICHARGGNADLPAQWLVYIAVADLDASLREALARGGEVVAGPRPLAGGRFAVVRDPAGAVCALHEG